MRRAVAAMVTALLGLAGLVAVASPAQAADRPTNWGFESGLNGWTVTSGSFANLRTNLATQHNGGGPYTKSGDWFLSTLETTNPAAPSDAQTGQVESPAFTATTGTVRVLVGGGSGAGTYVGVANAAGTVLVRTQGNDSETMVLRTLDVTPWVGQSLHLVLVDQSTAGWGHITVDDVTVDDVGVIYDFEDGTQQGWTVGPGSSFGTLITDLAAEHNGGAPYTKQGRYFLSTLEPTSSGSPGDAHTGTVTSPSFVLTQPVISLLVGGGAGENTYVGVVQNSTGQIVRAVRGNNSERMDRHYLDLSAYLGQSLSLRVVDNNPMEGWGHITLDDVQVNRLLSGPHTFDFENPADGAGQGWRQTAGSFGRWFVTDSDTRQDSLPLPVHKQGGAFLSTGQADDGTIDRSYTGEVTSPDFVLSTRQMSFLLGNELSPSAYLVLETADGVPIWQSPGAGAGTSSKFMSRYTIPVPVSALGKVVRFRVVDNDPNGYLTMDDVQVNLPTTTTPQPVREFRVGREAAGTIHYQWIPPVGYRSGSTYQLSRADLATATAANPAGDQQVQTTFQWNVAAAKTLASAVDPAKGYIYRLREVTANGTLGPPAYAITRPYKDLTARGSTKVYTGKNLTNIRFPVGPLGEGGILHDGTGRRRNWQNLYTNSNPGNATYTASYLPDTFFAVRGGSGAVAALQSEWQGSFPPSPLSMTAEFPIGSYTFDSPVPGVKVTEKFNSPMVPGNLADLKNSLVPAAVYSFTLTNTSTSSQQVSLLSAQQNPIGWNGVAAISGTSYSGYGSNTNTVTSDGSGTKIAMTKAGNSASMRLSTTAANTTAVAGVSSPAALFSDFSADGALTPGATTATSGAGSTVDAAMATVTLAPGASTTIPVVLRWWVPTALHQDVYNGRRYVGVWGSTTALDAFLDGTGLTRAQAQTQTYHDTLYDSTLPQYVLDRASAGTSILHAQSVYYAENGLFGGYEGYGCCDGMPPHVWHYNQNIDALFPDIGQAILDFAYTKLNAQGALPERPWSVSGPASIDGQAGTILHSYRIYLSKSPSEASAWLSAQWPNIKKATDWIWQTYDPNRTGTLTQGSPHNTLDTDFTGTSSWLGTMYLAAAQAAAKMATAQGDTAEATLLTNLVTAGRTAQNEKLYNGQYYRELSRGGGTSYNDGVAIDMLLGQWWSDLLGLDQLYPVDRQTQSLRTLFRSNYKNNYIGVLEGAPAWNNRPFVAQTDAGTRMFSWLHDDRPGNTVFYANEVMSGFEHAAAAAMIQKGLVDQGLTMENAINDRYDGVERKDGVWTGGCGVGDATGNPLSEDECGQWYGRSGSSWSVLQALQGLTYNGPQQSIGFDPKFKPADHKSFFTAGSAWGSFQQTRSGNTQIDTITAAHNSLALKTIRLKTTFSPTRADVFLRGCLLLVTWLAASLG